jgi:hypothetical protein
MSRPARTAATTIPSAAEVPLASWWQSAQVESAGRASSPVPPGAAWQTSHPISSFFTWTAWL